MQIDPSIFPPELLGRMTFTITPPTKDPLPPGLHSLGLAEERDTLLLVPEGLEPSRPVPLFVMFHGASGSAEKVMPFVTDYAHKHKFIIMLPQSTYYTWDLTIGGHGPDLDRLGKALNIVSSHFAIDPEHFALAGFSDGASYALSTGLTNGDLISHIIVLSGGFMNVYMKTGKPRVFITHSPEDEQLNIKTSALKHHKELKELGYDIHFELFSGPHVIYPPVVEKAMAFFLEKKS
ncbi:esterase [Oxalobacter sp. OttesenSCG-928-P03]|nr:esterase [Oxalobacter sp. OttesenSCG-928-P03]